ncbi:GntR family transcriptional regulator [uncultured Ruegeria sp.]|uniref:GntR family transcriptional regulator n=1 Tax=uncultured Ruegeria sp. TaxID=259304 RepID=UPI0026335C3B|nr:GntR family transcriptional regulator [uncultured Ruegeria sp.]
MNKPLYQTAYDEILKLIAEGTFPPGSILPNEFEIGKRLNVSQGTARKALSLLEQKGVVQRRQGKGTFVTLRTPEDSLFNFYPLRDDQGQQVIPDLENESVTKRKATKAEQEILHDAPQEVFVISRYRTLNGSPLTLEESIVPAPLFPGLPERAPLPNAMYVLFQHAYACVIISAVEQLRAEILGEEKAGPHGLDPTSPVLVGRRESLDLLDRVVEIRTNIYFTTEAHYSAKLE